jgi:hypothetical protein
MLRSLHLFPALERIFPLSPFSAAARDRMYQRYYKQKLRDPEEIRRGQRQAITGPVTPRESITLERCDCEKKGVLSAEGCLEKGEAGVFGLGGRVISSSSSSSSLLLLCLHLALLHSRGIREDVSSRLPGVTMFDGRWPSKRRKLAGKIDALFCECQRICSLHAISRE